MTRFCACLGLGLAVFASLPASAATFTALPQATYLIDLDTPSQHLSAWRLDDLGSVNAVRATISINAVIATDGRIKPGFLIDFKNGDESASLFILAVPTTQKLAITLGGTRGDNDLGGGGAFLGSLVIGVGQSFDLAIDWTPDGKLTATLNGGESLSVQMSKPPRQLEINGTSGEIEFKTLSLGHWAP